MASNIFPLPSISPDLIRMEETTLTEEEKNITDKLGWTHKFDGIVAKEKIKRVRWLVVIMPFIAKLLSHGAGFVVFDLIIDYLTVTDFLLLAAASDKILAPFFRPTSKIIKRLMSKIVNKLPTDQRLCSTAPFALCNIRLKQLTNGKDLLGEYRSFRQSHYLWSLDESTLFGNIYVTLVKFHPTK
jgi:hypothetical protein